MKQNLNHTTQDLENTEKGCWGLIISKATNKIYHEKHWTGPLEGPYVASDNHASHALV